MQSDYFKGYIEGYYGKLLSWNDRKKILIKLNSLKLNYYFYTPKEDLALRKNWKKPFSKEWLNKFNDFCNFANKLNISIIAGISPGLSFSFSQNYKQDFNTLHEKFKLLKNHGAKIISILFDDIPDPINFKDKNNISEGRAHAILCNEVFKQIKIPVVTVPRVYSDEIKCDSNYLNNFMNELNKKIKIFYCGKYIISNNLSSSNKVMKTHIKK